MDIEYESIRGWLAGYGILTLILTLISMAAIRSGRKQRLIQNIPTSKTAGVFIGLVEVKGTAECEVPLVSELAREKCVQFEFSVSEHWSRTVTETYTDSDGKSQTRTRTESGWTTLESGGKETAFYLQDETGLLRILPENARIEPMTLFERSVRRGDDLYYSRGHHQAIRDSTHRRRFMESGIPLHKELYIMGQSRERQDIAAAEIAHDPQARLFLISTHPEDKIQKAYGRGFWLWGIFGLILAGLSPWGIQKIVLKADDYPVVPALITLGIYILQFSVRWGLMIFNDLIDLKNRVEQAESNIDIQLKRRHELIPRLVNIVRGLVRHESEVQTHLAQLRSQSAITSARQSGDSAIACQPIIHIISEQYPNISADHGFNKLRENLIDTEQRIALARNYFNDICTQYNTRCQTIPDQFLASLAGLKSVPLFHMQDLHREPIQVNLAK